MRKNRRDGLYRRNRGLFAFRYKDATGWHEKSTGTRDRSDALAAKRQFEKDLENDERPTDKADWPAGDAVAHWVRQHGKDLGSDRARGNERSLLRQLCQRLPSVKLREINLDVLKDYQAARKAELVASGFKGARAVNLEVQLLVNTLKEANLFKGRVAKHFKRLKEEKSDLVGRIPAADLDRLERTARMNPAWEVVYCAELLAANCGLRGGEIKQLRLGMLDLPARRIYIRRSITKSDAGERLVELNQAAYEAASRLVRRAQLLGASDPDHFLFPADLSRHTKSTDPLCGGRGYDPREHQRSFRTAWRKMCVAARMPQQRFHNLRHTFISAMAENGTPLAVTQAMVGHMSAAVTKRYTQISTTAARLAVEKLDHDSGAVCGCFCGWHYEPRKDYCQAIELKAWAVSSVG